MSIESIRQRWEKATPGDWWVVEEVDGVYAGRMTVVRANGNKRIVTVDQTRPHDSEHAEANVEAIAHAPTDIQALLAVAVAARDHFTSMPDSAQPGRQRLLCCPRCSRSGAMSIEEIRKRWQAATPGPWESMSTGDAEYVLHRYDSGAPVSVALTWAGIENAIVIAHAPTDIAWLLERCEKLEADLSIEQRALRLLTERVAELLDCIEKLKAVATAARKMVDAGLYAPGCAEPDCELCDALDALESLS
jgi:hypothetical protein